MFLCIVCDDLALVDNYYLIADSLHLRKDMGRKDNGMIFAELSYKSSYLDYLLRVKTYCRLVQDKNLWIADKSLSKTYSLSITFLQVLDYSVINMVYLYKSAYIFKM